MSEMNTQGPPEVHTDLATKHELEIEQASTPVLEALCSEAQGQTREANRLRAVHAEKELLDFENLAKQAVEYPGWSPDEYMNPIHRLVAEHDGDLRATVADPRFGESVLELVQREDIGFFDKYDNATVRPDEILSFVRERVSVKVETLAQDMTAAMASGAVKAAALGQSTKEQYGTEKVLQKAMQASSFASSQQQFPVAHAAAGEGRATKTITTKAPAQRQGQQPGLAR